ncbi:MAG: stage II sporulation protein M [Acidobacteria bacterium]|nr:stage II sporulation protein M [Acidobacteriota bacterium]MBV9437220.1 stage II sporulation protein M [Acidobacteriota bacterium]
MISTHWLEKRRPFWEELEKLLAQCGGSGIGALSRRELRSLSLLYRQVAADLSILRQDPSGKVYATHLNRLLARAHNIIYVGKRGGPLGILRFYARTYPVVFRRNIKYVLTAFIVFLSGAVAGLIATLHNPGFELQVLGPGMVQTIERHQMWTHSVVAIKPVASSAIMTNNLSVTFSTFAFGITAGMGTLYLLFFNGLLLGVVGTACWLNQMSLQLWSFVAAHGVLELPAIFIAGGAGLRIAQGMLFPEFLSRRDSLQIAGSEATQLLLGTIPMLIIAGLLEGFLSPTAEPPLLKFSVGGALFLLLVLYLGGASAGRTSDPEEVPNDALLSPSR